MSKIRKDSEIMKYMKETSRESDNYTLDLLDGLKSEGRDIYEYAIHLPYLRNRLKNGNKAIPKARNALGRLIYESLTDKDWREIIPALSFIELSTVATYVLDDIIDNQPERQRDEATWKKYGINKGIIAGSLQTFLSIDTLSNLDVNDSNKIKILNLANNMWLKLWIGEGFNEEMKENTTFGGYINRSYNIAGVMFDTISQVSAICAIGNESEIEIASNAGKNYGIAQMIRNDLIDLLPNFGESSGALSKKPHEDIEKGIWTFPIIHLMQNADEGDKRLVMALMGNKSDNNTYSLMESMLNKYNSINATLDLITEYKKRANLEIIKLPESKSRELLLELIGLLENLRGI